MFVKRFGLYLSGLGAGIVNGLFGAGGGMVLVPLLTGLTDLEEDQIFPSSVAIILPICLISLFMSANVTSLSWSELLPYFL